MASESDEENPPLRIKIKRRASDDVMPHWQDVEVPFDEDATLLDALATIDGVAVAARCSDQKCGQCAMLLNDEPLLACRVKHGELEEPIEARPLAQARGVSDLLLNQAVIKARSGELPTAGCIDCGLCLEVCPSYSADGTFAGPAALFRAEAAQLAGDALTALHFWECDNVGNCTAACPEKLPIADAIARLKRGALFPSTKKSTPSR